jgi:hypothetical protein
MVSPLASFPDSPREGDFVLGPDGRWREVIDGQLQEIDGRDFDNVEDAIAWVKNSDG